MIQETKQKNITKVLRGARQKAGISQAELAKKIGMSQASYSAIEIASTRCGIIHANQIAIALGDKSFSQTIIRAVQDDLDDAKNEIKIINPD